MRSALFALLALAACAAQTAPPPASDPPTNTSDLAPRIRADLARLDAELAAPGIVVAGIGQSADLGRGLIVRPLAVIEDSRCPQDVTCVWAGRLVVRVSLGGMEQNVTLGETVESSSGAVTFVAASPGAWASWPANLPRPAYRFGFRAD